MIRKLIGPNYPKTSCECSECPISGTPLWPASNISKSDTNNLGLKDCNQINDISSCKSTSFVNSNKYPNTWTENPYTILNPNFGLETSPGFFHDVDGNKCHCPPIKNHKKHTQINTVTALDPRLMYPIRGPGYQQLDRIPYTGNVLLKDIYDSKYANYGKNYKNYKDIHSGQIMYYLDEDIDQPYFLPNYTIRSQVNAEVFKTPMGGTWPRYPKTPLTKNSNYISPQQFTRDTVANREDLMSLQMARFNREKYPIN